MQALVEVKVRKDQVEAVIWKKHAMLNQIDKIFNWVSKAR